MGRIAPGFAESKTEGILTGHEHAPDKALSVIDDPMSSRVAADFETVRGEGRPSIAARRPRLPYPVRVFPRALERIFGGAGTLPGNVGMALARPDKTAE